MTSMHVCAGIGLHAEGFRRGGFDPVAFCEIDPFCRAVLAEHFDGWIHDDLRSLTAQSVRDRLGYIPDLIEGGIPCQPASVAGKRRGIADERWLWAEFVRVVVDCKPRYFVAENVRGFMSLAESEPVFAALESAGYEIAPFVLGAEHVGAPHRRHRVWVVGRNMAVADGGESHTRRRNDAEVPGDAQGEGESEHRSAVPARSGRTDGRSATLLANPQRDGGREREPGRGTEIGAAVGGAGEAVDDAAGARCTGDAGRETPQPIRDEARRAQSAGSRCCDLIGGCQRCGNELADAAEPRLQGHGTDAGQPQGREPRSAGAPTRWPARPGERQYDFEQPRLIKWEVGFEFARCASGLVRHILGVLKYVNDNPQVRPSEAMRVLQWAADPQEIQRTAGRFNEVQAEALLQLILHGEGANESDANAPSDPSAHTEGDHIEAGMRGVRIDGEAVTATPPGREPAQQRSGKRKDALRAMPCDVALAEREARETVRRLRRHNRETLRAAGNANPIQVAEVIGRAIMEAEE